MPHGTHSNAFQCQPHVQDSRTPQRTIDIRNSSHAAPPGLAAPSSMTKSSRAGFGTGASTRWHSGVKARTEGNTLSSGSYNTRHEFTMTCTCLFVLVRAHEEEDISCLPTKRGAITVIHQVHQHPALASVFGHLRSQRRIAIYQI